MPTATEHRHPAVIELEHADVLTVAAFRLDALAREHAESKGYISASSVAWHAQAKKLREFVAANGR